MEIDPKNELGNPKNQHRLITAVLVFGACLLLAAGAIHLIKQRSGALRFNTTPLGSPDAFQNIKQPDLPPPVKFRIPKLGIDTNVVKLGINKDGTLQVPEGDTEVGWFVGGAVPGQNGPAVIVGHLDSVKGPAVFWHLNNLKEGDTIEVEMQDGSKATYKVDSKQTFSQDNFPTDKVYGATSTPTIRLITCAGTYRRFAGRYSDNLVVFGSLIPNPIK